jgi:hypothetical protein
MLVPELQPDDCAWHPFILKCVVPVFVMYDFFYVHVFLKAQEIIIMLQFLLTSVNPQNVGSILIPKDFFFFFFIEFVA